jgi:hypothetical protein
MYWGTVRPNRRRRGIFRSKDYLDRKYWERYDKRKAKSARKKLAKRGWKFLTPFLILYQFLTRK